MKKIIAIFVAVSLYGCASVDSQVSKSFVPRNGNKLSLTIKNDSGVSIPVDQYQLLETQIREGLSQNGLLAAHEKNSQYAVIVNLHTFKLRSDASRLTVGILAGCDNINSTVIVNDKITNEEIGNSQISIKECGAWGVASQVIKKYTDGVVTYLSNK